MIIIIYTYVRAYKYGGAGAVRRTYGNSQTYLRVRDVYSTSYLSVHVLRVRELIFDGYCMYTLSDMSTHNTLSPGYETPDYECRY